MKLFSRLTIRNQLNIIILSVTLITVIIGFILFSYNTTKIYKINLINNGILNARLVGEFALIPLTYAEKERAIQTLNKLKKIPHISNCLVYDEYGNLFVSYNKQKNNLVQQKKFYSDTTFYGKNYLHIYEPIYFQAIKYGTIYLRISTHSVDERINEQIKTMALLLLGLIIISILISNYFQNIISHPIIKLSNFAVKISKSKNITERINYDAKDEIGDLYTSFNIMLNQIEKREKENKQARVNLRENQRQLVEIIDAIPQFIYIKDINNKFLLVNKKLSAFFKIPANEIIGRKQTDLKAWLTFKLDSNDDLIKVIEKNESIFIPEVEINDMWGNLLYLQITKLPFIYNGSMALLGVGVDVTDVIKGEKALRESQELFSVFMDRMPAATFIKNSKSEYLYVNEYLKKNFDAHNWINTRKVINSKGESKRMEIEDEKALKQATSFEEKLIDKHGNIRHYETWKFPIKREDKAPLIGGISVENTKKKRAEQRIIFYIEELKRNNQELAEFNYVASHDLKEPLRTLTSYCELLEEDVGDKLNDEAKEDLDFITNAAARMNALIQDLLELSRAGRVELKNQKADLNQCLNIAITDLDHFIKKKEAIIDKGKLPQVWGDKIHLTRIFQNLIHNAIKFNDSKQPIVKIFAIENSENLVKIVIEDNGIGIENEFISQIFAPFKRLHPKGKYEGTGIGLAICKKIIERHGGKLELNSKIDEGSSFIFSLKKHKSDNIKN